MAYSKEKLTDAVEKKQISDLLDKDFQSLFKYAQRAQRNHEQRANKSRRTMH